MEEIVAGIRKRYLKAFSDHFEKADGSPIYAADLIMFGLMDRNIGLVESMPKLIEDENIHALAPLLRVQLDGLLRIHAFRLVTEPEELAVHVIKGGELRKYKDRDGNKLTDRYLVNSLKDDLPYVESMYDKLCGWVHFSESHIFTAATEGKEPQSIEIGIGGFRKKIGSEIFEDAIQAIEAIHKATTEIIEAYFSMPRTRV